MSKPLKLELYAAGGEPVGGQLREELVKAIEESGMQAEVDVVDVIDTPIKALENDIYATPTLVRVFPEPVVKVILNAAKMQGVVLLIKPEDGD